MDAAAHDGGRDVTSTDMGSRDVPVVDVPVVDVPVADTPVVDTPVVDTPVVDSPVIDTPVVDMALPDSARPDATPDTGVPDMGAPDTGTLDATTDVLTLRDARPDVPPDVMRGSSPLFGRCTADVDCHDPDGACLTSFPGGLCTRDCASDAACGPSGRCFLGSCLPACSLGGGECSTSSNCFIIDAVDDTRRACFPSCWGTPPAGTLTCNTGLSCDQYAGSCTTMPRTGADNGQPCTMNSDCRGNRCIAETDMTGQPTGWLGGYCYSTGRAPDATSYAIDMPIPQSNCPAGTVAIPVETGFGAGDVALCLLACTSSAGCRAGYECVFLNDGMGGRTTNGYCAPFNCLAPGAIACPTGTTCRDVTGDAGGARRGVCAH